MSRSSRAAARLVWADGSDWPRRLSRPGLSPDELAGIVIAALAIRLPEHQVEATEESATITSPEGHVLKARLGALFSALTHTPAEERLGKFEPFLRALITAVANLGNATRRAPSRRRLLPLVRNPRYIGEDGTNLGLYSEPFVGEFLVMYAWANPDAFDLVTHDERRKLRLGAGRLRALALENLRRLLPEVEFYRHGSVWAAGTGGHLEPSLLLLDDFCAARAKEVEGDLVVSIPSQEIFLYTGTDVPGGVEHLRELAAHVTKSGAAPLAETLLRRAGDRWVEHLPETILN
jgi:hypothetical protein